MRYAPPPAALALPALGGCAPAPPAPTLESCRGAAPPFAEAVRYPEDTSRIPRRLDDAALRNAALGEDCFRPLDPDYRAPPICAAAG